MNLPVVIIGAGGHARVLIDALKLKGVPILFIVDNDTTKKGQSVLGIDVVGGDRAIFELEPTSALLVNGVGSVKLPKGRREIFCRFKEKGYRFFTVVHPSAVIATDVQLAEGAQIMAGAVIQTGTTIGANTIVNTKASIDHDCVIGDHTHIAPGVTVSGGVIVGEGTHIGTAATVIQGVTIGSDTTVGAGSVVIRDVGDGISVMGVPARVREK